MPKIKHKTVRYFVSLTDAQAEMLRLLMEQDGYTSVSDYFPFMVRNLMVLRDQTTRRSVGRPREKEEEEQAIYDHPDTMFHKGKKITRSELEMYYELKGMHMPEGI